MAWYHERIPIFTLGKTSPNSFSFFLIFITFSHFENTEISGFEAITGLGVKAIVNGSTVIAGNESLMKSGNIIFEIPTEIAKQIPFGSTSVFVGIEGKLAGIICLEDMARPESISAVGKIREMGLEVVMLTGDQQTSADAVAKKTGITNLHYGVRPEEKSKIITRLNFQRCYFIFGKSVY